MQDSEKTEVHLLHELAVLRDQVAHWKALYAAEKRAEAALQDSEARYRSLFENANDAIATFALDGTITSVNRGAERLLGYSRSELIGQHVRKVSTPASVALAEERTRRWRAGERLPATFEAELVCKDGRVVPVEAQTRTIRDRDGRPVGFQGIYRDLTERKRVEVELRTSVAALRAVFDNSRQAFLLMDPQRVIRAFNRVANERALRLYGRELRAGESVYGFVRPEDRPTFDHHCERALCGEFLAIEQPVRDEGNGEHWFEFTYSPVFTDDRQCLGVCLGIVDITERKQVEEALRHRELYFRSLSENALDVITIVNADGTIRYVSPSAERVLGYTAADVVGTGGFEFVHPEDIPLVSNAFVQVVEHPGETLRTEFRARHKHGSWRVLEAVERNLLHDPTVAGIVVNSRDVTERKEAEEALHHAKAAAEAASRAKSEFLATMSHELRTPLSVIIGYTSLLLEEFFGRLTIEQADTLRRVDAKARELLELISVVLDVSRLEAGRLPVELTEVGGQELLHEIRAEFREIEEQSNLTFVWHLEGPLPSLRTDPGKLKVVIKHLVNNAIKFTEEGSITVRARSRGEGIEISVTDTGAGIPQEALALIFEPFCQVEGSSHRRYGGTGLGLHIVKRLLELLGGTVTVESEAGRGSTFRVWVPTGTPPQVPVGQGLQSGASS